jgi:hypothetical protein
MGEFNLIWIIDILMVIVIVRFLANPEVRKRLKSYFRGDKPIEFEGKTNYQALFDKLVRVAKDQGLINMPSDIFKIACKEKGFGWSDEHCERDFDKWMKYGFRDDSLPNYVELFLEDGKEYIINA